MIQHREDSFGFIDKDSQKRSLSINESNCGNLIKASELNIILSDDNFSKSYFNLIVISQILKKGCSVAYMDIDTVFSAFLPHMNLSLPDAGNLILFTSDSSNLEKTILQLCSVKLPYLGLVVIDSLTILYHVLSKEYNPSILNRKIAVYLSLLQNFANRQGIPVIVTSMTRSKIKSKKDQSWFLSPTGDRFFSKLNNVLKLSNIRNNIKINIIRHSNSHLIGKIVLMPIKINL
jgi:hypothetical protein